MGSTGAKRLAFLYGGLRALDADLQARGSRLIVRRGDPLAVLTALRAETDAAAIYAETDYSPYARRRGAALAAALPLTLVDGVLVHPPGAVLKADGMPYTVFTPFSRVWKKRPPPDSAGLTSAPERVPTFSGDLDRIEIPSEPVLPAGVPFVAGEAAAQQRLDAFLAGPISTYATDRDRMDLDGTARLSPYLRFGMIAPRQVILAARAAYVEAGSKEGRAGAEKWLDELIWREFFIHILYHFPRVHAAAFREELQDIAWRNDEAEFAAWCEGRTGYPVVDAAMRQLTTSG